MNSLQIALIGTGVLVLALVWFVISRIKVGGPNQAFIVTGRASKSGMSGDLSGQRVVTGGSVFVMPFVQRLEVLDLTSRQIPVGVPAAVSANGIRCSLEAVAVVKVGGTEELIRAAAQRFLGQQDAIDQFTKEVLAGSLRAIVGRLSVESIIRDRGAFAAAVAEEAEASLTNQGLVLDTFQLQDIQAEGSYLADLGRPEAARAAKEATIAEALARREAEEARFKAEESIALAAQTLALKQAEIKQETDAAQARADAAGPIAKAAQDQEIIRAQEAVAQQRAVLTERELDTQIRKPADAAKYAAEQQAEANRATQVAQAEAEAEKMRRLGDAENSRRQALAEAVRIEAASEQARREALARALEAEGKAEASATAARGDAEAGAIKAKGDAEAAVMDAKASAFARYNDAAVLQILAEMLPQVVREAATPMSAIDSMTVISTDGAADVVRNVASTVAQGRQLSKDIMGVDLAALISGALGNKLGDLASQPPAPQA